MPSQFDASQVTSGPGKIHTDVVTAAAELFTSGASGGGGGVTPDILAQLLAAPSVTAPIVANVSTGDASYTIVNGTYGVFWTGSSGSESLNDLFKVVNSSDDTDVFNPITNTYVSVASLSIAVGSGFYNNPITLTFNTSVPAGVSYKIFFSKQTILSALPKELASFPTIRRSAERVRFPENIRTGLAPTSVANPLDIVANPYPDPYMAQWKSLLRGTAATYTAQASGSAGFVNIGRKKNVLDANDVSFAGHQASAFLAVYEKEITSGTLNGQTVYTKIDPSLAATVNPTGSADMVQLNSADYFRLTSPSHLTAIRCGVDMLEITFVSGLKEVFIIGSLDATDVHRARLLTLGGATANFPTTLTNVHLKWIRTGAFLGGDNDAGTANPHYYKGFSHLVQGAITTSPAAELAQEPPFFSAGTIDNTRADLSRGNWNIKAFTWGGYTQTGAAPANIGQRTINGELWGDGSIITFGGRNIGLKNNRSVLSVINSNTTTTWDPTANSMIGNIFVGTTSCVWTIVMAGSYVPFEGDEITVTINYGGTIGSDSELSTVAWPSNFLFSGFDANTPSPTGTTLKFNGTYFNSKFLMTRTDYQP